MSGITTNTFEISNLILVPFVTEIKRLLKSTDEFKYVEKENGIIDTKNTKSYVMVENTGSHALREKYPMISIGRSAMEFFLPYIASQSDHQSIWDDERAYGDAYQTNIHIQVETHSKLRSERLASFIFNFFRFNKIIFRNYGITDVRFNYLSSAIPTKNGDDETITVYQVGINVVAKVYENHRLTSSISDEAIKDFLITIYPFSSEEALNQSGTGLSIRELEERIREIENKLNVTEDESNFVVVKDDEPEDEKDIWFDID